jgi:hypothetical protein
MAIAPFFVEILTGQYCKNIWKRESGNLILKLFQANYLKHPGPLETKLSSPKLLQNELRCDVV